MAKCNKCGCQGLVWKQSKNQKWYLGVEKIWQGDMGGVRSFYPAHRCQEQQESYERNESFLFDLQPRSGA